jgi:hypothetical protein
MIDSASFDTKLAVYLSGSYVKFLSKVRFLGNPQDILLKLRAPDFDGKKVFEALWKSLTDKLTA